MLTSVVLQCTLLLDPYCRPRQGVWGGWETAAQPLDEGNLLWTSLIRILSKMDEWASLIRILWFCYGHYLKGLALCIA
jgi:hypothetical protein